MTERRNDDQDTAMEAAFIAGVLPEEDRRAPEEAPLEEVIPVYEWLRRGDGTEVLYTNGQIEGDSDVIAAQRVIREATS